jgi:hypothetical protein
MLQYILKYKLDPSKLGTLQLAQGVSRSPTGETIRLGIRVPKNSSIGEQTRYYDAESKSSFDID